MRYSSLIASTLRTERAGGSACRKGRAAAAGTTVWRDIQEQNELETLREVRRKFGEPCRFCGSFASRRTAPKTRKTCRKTSSCLMDWSAWWTGGGAFVLLISVRDQLVF